MTPELIEAIARAICGMPSCGAPKCPCGFAYDQMDAAQAALDAIKAAGWVVVRKPEDRSAEWDALKANAPVDPWFQQPETD